MRRPLFGNGIPRNILQTDGDVTILDTEDLDEGAVYALTLFLWVYIPGAAPFTLPTFVVEDHIEGGPGVLLARYVNTHLDTVFSSHNGPAPIEPIKVLDRYMMRGQQRVTVRNEVVGANIGCVVWGYFEQIGDQDVGVPFRGLQPTTPVSPYVFNPVAIDLPFSLVAQGQQKLVHTLDPNYIDLVTIDVVWAAVADTTANWAAGLLMPNGGGGSIVAMPSIALKFPPAVPVAPTDLIRSRVFDGIPMRALGTAPNQAQINLVATAGIGSEGFARAYGSFVRT